MPLQAIEMNVPNEYVQLVIDAAIQAEVDYIDHPNEDGLSVKMIFLVTDVYDLFIMGYGHGAEVMYNSVSGPLAEIIATVEKRVDNFKNKKDV